MTAHPSSLCDPNPTKQRQGWSIHDSWVPYFSYSQTKHGLCNAHLVRELVFLIERHTQTWAQDFLDLLLEMKRHVESAKRGKHPTPPSQELSFYEQRQGSSAGLSV